MYQIGDESMIGIIDRIEENIDMIEIDGEMVPTEIHKLPKGVKEGDVLEEKNGKFKILPKKTKERKKYMDNLFKELSGQRDK